MAGVLARFTASGNNADFYNGCCPLPDTPFQVLYVDPHTANGVLTSDGGFATSGSNTFSNVRPGTIFFLPVINADDSPPFPAPYPSNHRDAIPYLFDQRFYGASFQVTIDGQTTSVGSEYVAGPVKTAPLPDTTPPDFVPGTHMITLGAFVRPLTPGTHTVSISGGVFGDAEKPTYGVAYLTEAITYTVNVI
jgi:hypothetical protein